MAGKFVDLKEAAKILGVSAEDLVDMRSRGEIFGYRDGASWKFKIEEVERVASERSAAGRSGSGVLEGDDAFEEILSGSDAGRSATEGGEESADSVLVSDDPVGSSIGKQSTVIGKELRGTRPEDSDLKLASEEGAAGQAPKSLTGGSDVAYDLGSESALGLADSKKGSGALKPGSSKGGSGKDADVLGDIELARPGSGTGDLSDVASGVELAIAGSDAYSLEEATQPGDDDSISLDASELKKGPGTGSDVTHRPGDSGINLRSPSDSGLSLDEEPLDLGGSGVDSLELPEDDDVIALEEEIADPDLATQLKADEAFSLSPAALEGGADDESDSGSQVIALEDSSAFDQQAATMLSPEAAPLMPEGAFSEVAMPGFDMTAAAPGLMPGTMAGAQPYVAPAPVEKPYSVWNVLGLMATAGVLALAGMLMWDLMLNMWSFNEPGGVTTSLMDAIVSAAGLSGR